METEDQLQQKEQEKQKVSRYIVSYRGVSQGLEKLYIPGSDGESRNILHVLRIREYGHSQYPFTMTVYPDPTQLAHPVREVTGLNYPYGIAFNSHGEMIVSEWRGHQVAIFDFRGQRIRTFGSHGDSPEQMENPAGIAIDDMDNIYVTSHHKLQKFTSSGELIKCVGQRGSKEGEFKDPGGLALHNNQVYVCDSDNHRIQVFDLDLNFIQSIGSHGKGRGEFAVPHDVKFDKDGNMYIAELSNERVQVLHRSACGHFIKVGQRPGYHQSDFTLNGYRRCVSLSVYPAGPIALHIVNKYVYVSDYNSHCIVVYETSGQFVTSFGRRGQKGEFIGPHCIASCADGFIHVCDTWNNRVQIF